MIAGLKERMKELETHNEELQAENQELRAFSADGVQIAKNVQALGAERERLAANLAEQ
jgi:regulator of replication initiation timing